MARVGAQHGVGATIYHIGQKKQNLRVSRKRERKKEEQKDPFGGDDARFGLVPGGDFLLEDQPLVITWWGGETKEPLAAW